MNNIDLPSNLEELDALDQALENADLDHMEQMDPDPSEPQDLMTDAEADADVLASAGMGTDEDYGGGFEHY
jgi:hypothetical protein